MIETPTEGPRVMRQWFQMKIGERMTQMAMMVKGRQQVMDIARKMADGTFGKPDTAGQPEDDEMNIRVGDETHHHYPQETTPGKPAASKLSKLALAGALAMGTGGIGIGAAIPLVLDALKPDAPPLPPPAVTFPADTDTRNRIRLS